ncbi:iron-containing alcohol dehydrogenase [Aestuariibaculum lutulentum]|uniref:Iron-containing alcohol dehydrogenase n=1 Tax=Aestuariibaculum lutulentum TaxID=2920935 RepID=A0ABS9RFH2_9FLAO|nr:iron-containing alcohol dehydrogenase [Aestuariibaculum lutulentum]MCH4551701.1 iron-containing alcohol dehydrogenase [Aestuariibaculum lutulentum]
MDSITLLQPQKIIFGSGSLKKLVEDRNIEKSQRILFLVAPPLLGVVKSVVEELTANSKKVYLAEYKFLGEPTFSQFNTLLEENKSLNPDCIVGVGGGSVLDCAKLLAALLKNDQKLEDVVGIGFLKERVLNLICIPTTSGTGSEVSPNAILLNEASQAKSGIISPYLVPDACYLDPALTISLPPKLTAETGIDALSHCIEAYTNKFAHPTVDVYALKGIELIAANIEKAYLNGNDIQARSALLLGSMYGGLCLGPVNTSAVHALSYGLGGKFHVPHGLSNAILMPEVLRYNLSASPKRHAEVARALGITIKGTDEAISLAGIEKIEAISRVCNIPLRLTEIGVNEVVIPELADIAMKVTRLLKNNPREVTRTDAINIYKKLL